MNSPHQQCRQAGEQAVINACGPGGAVSQPSRPEITTAGFLPTSWSRDPDVFNEHRRKRAGEPIDWRPLFAGYRATLDWPGAWFWRELTAAHPDANVILTVRDPERWYDSAHATIYAASQAREEDFPTRLMAKLLTWLDPRAGHGFQVVQETVWDGTFGGQFADRAAALRIFSEQNREVETTIPPDRLLVFDVKQGWEPLCTFLGVPVPAGEPFPHVNDSADFSRRQQEQYLRLGRALAPALGFALAGGVLGLALGLNRRRAKSSPRD